MAQKLFFGLLLTFPLASYVMQLACAIDLVVPLYRGGSYSVHQPDLEIAIIHDHVNILFRLLHVIEYSVLIVGICKCHKSEESDFNLLKSMSVLIKNNYWRMSIKTKLCACSFHCVYTWCKGVLEWLILITLLATYTIVIVMTSWRFHDWDQSSCNATRHPFCAKACVSNVCISLVSTYMVRMFMIAVTFLVAATWLRGKSELSEADNYSSLVDGYKETGKQASSLHVIFKRWFILQWLVIFFEILEEFYFIYDLLSNGSGGSYEFDSLQQSDHHQLLVHIALLSYRLFSFVIPYLCGLTMNYYHRKYRKAMHKEQQTLAPNQSVYLIPENLKYQFRPSIFEISIPLNETAHILTVTLALVAFALSLISKSVN